jgi:hypothetical protein
MFPRQQEKTAVMEETFSPLPVPKRYDQSHLAVTVTELPSFKCYELLLENRGKIMTTVESRYKATAVKT